MAKKRIDSAETEQEMLNLCGRKITETYRLDCTKLAEMIVKLVTAKKNDMPVAYLREDGTIGIHGHVQCETGRGISGDIGRLVEGSRIGKTACTLYLQTFEHQGDEQAIPNPNLVDLFREYFI